ncbi:DNA-binding protein, partial [Paeniclostridium sordellii]|nr:DNA-binding protein [Paeniclostridium sordellii]
MYIDNDDFSVWMQKLYAKLEEPCKDVRVLR